MGPRAFTDSHLDPEIGLLVRAEESEAQRPESCGKPLKPMTWFARVVR